MRFLKTIPLKLSLLRGSRPKSARARPHICLALFEISSKSVREVIVERVKTVFAPYSIYNRLYETIKMAFGRASVYGN